MSLIFANNQTPFWLSSSGVDSVYFNKLTSPPLAYFDKGVLYELIDGVLYFNGLPLSGGTPFNDNSTDRIIYTAPNGSPTGTGKFVDPVDTLASAMALVPDDTGYSINLSYQDSSNFSMKTGSYIYGTTTPNTIINGLVDINDVSWTLPAASGINQAGIQNCVISNSLNLDFTGYLTPLFVMKDCTLVNTTTITGYYDALNSFRSKIFTSNCFSFGDITINDCDYLMNFDNKLSLFPLNNITINKNGSDPMQIDCYYSSMTSNISVFYNNGATDTLTCTFTGDGVTILLTADPATLPGNFIVNTSANVNITYADIFTQGIVTLNYIDNSNLIEYSPANPADWSPVPVNVAEALDILATPNSSQPVFFNGVTTITGVNQNLTTGNKLNPYFSATNDYFDYVISDIQLTGFFYHLQRAVDITENINIRLIVNGNPVVNLGPLTSASPQEAVVPINYNLLPGDQIYILINAFAAVGNNDMSWSLYGNYIVP
jgi:hypothetical protein